MLRGWTLVDSDGVPDRSKKDGMLDVFGNDDGNNYDIDDDGDDEGRKSSR